MKLVLNIPDETFRLFQEKATKAGLSVESAILRAVDQLLSAPLPSSRVGLPLFPSRRPCSLRLNSARIYDVIGFP